MRAPGVNIGKDWIVVGDEKRGDQGAIQIKMLGALEGVPLAQLDVWAASVDDLVAFLRGATAALEQKYGRLVTPIRSTN